MWIAQQEQKHFVSSVVTSYFKINEIKNQPNCDHTQFKTNGGIVVEILMFENISKDYLIFCLDFQQTLWPSWGAYINKILWFRMCYQSCLIYFPPVMPPSNMAWNTNGSSYIEVYVRPQLSMTVIFTWPS